MNLTIEKKTDGQSKLTMKLTGRLDALTSPQLDEAFRTAAEGMKEAVLDSPAWIIFPLRACAR